MTTPIPVNPAVPPAPVLAFIAELSRLRPTMTVELERSGIGWWLDFSHRDPLEITVRWRPDHGFGLYWGPDVGYGEGANEIVADSAERAAERVDALMRGTGL